MSKGLTRIRRVLRRNFEDCEIRDQAWGNNEVASLKATIEKDSANVATQSSTIEDLASSIATDEADLKVATEIRDVAGKVTSIDTASEVDIYHVTNYSEADFLAAIETAVTNKNYREHAGLYVFLLTVSVETDASCRGEINSSDLSCRYPSRP